MVDDGGSCVEVDRVLGRADWDDDVAAGVDAWEAVDVAGDVGLRCGGVIWGR